MHNLETVLCPLCQGEAFTIVYPGNWPERMTEDFFTRVYRSSSDQTLFEQLVRCKNCGLCYLNPQLTASQIVESYAQGEDLAFVEQDAMRIRTFRAALKTVAKRHDIPLVANTNILDVGCAGGAFVRAAAGLGVSVMGLEPNVWMAEQARAQGLDVKTGTLADHTFPSESVDVVTLWDVIEHLSDPATALKQIRDVLKRGGLLVINYPDFGSIASKILGKKWPFLLSVHLIYYTRKTMRRQLEQAGFRILDMSTHWQTLELRYILKRATPYFSFLHVVERVVEKIGLGGLPITYWIGQTRVVAKKC